MTMEEYRDVFDARGAAYDEAMRSFPRARDEELRQVVERAALRPGDVVADVPAGGGYLREHLPPDSRWCGHEPSRGFRAARDRTAPPTTFLPLPWGDGSVDVVISLAGVHHIADKRELWRELLRVVKPGGRFVLSDVAVGTKPALFLDGYVGAHNLTGHAGHYLHDGTAEELRACGWTVVAAEQVDFVWLFDRPESAGRFCRQLFDLRGDTLAGTLGAITSGLGTVPQPDGGIGMRWSLFTLTCEPSKAR